MISYAERFDIELTGVAGGWTEVELPSLGVGTSFIVRNTRIREDTVDNNATALAALILADVAALSAAPPGEDTAYEGGAAIALTPHATDLSFADHVEFPAQFTVRTSTMKVGGNVTATGAYKLYVHLELEILLPG